MRSFFWKKATASRIKKEVAKIENIQKTPYQWLVDLENVGNRWHDILKAAAPDDTVHLFYSDKTVAIKISDLGPASARGLNFRFHACNNGLPNAMDFQMMCALGMLAAANPSDQFVIYTGDNGFKSVLGYLTDRGIKCTCIGPAQPEATPQPDVNITEAEPMPKLEPAARIAEAEPAPEPEQYNSLRLTYLNMCKDAGMIHEDARVMSAILMESMRRPANKRKLDCRNRMIQRWGNTDGGTMYTSLKTMIHRIADEGPWPEAAAKPAEPPLDASRVSALIDSRTGMCTSKVLGEKLLGMMTKALQTSNPAQSLKNQLESHYKNAGNAKKVMAVLQPYLLKMQEEKRR